MTPIWSCRQLQSGLIARSHLLWVSRQSYLSDGRGDINVGSVPRHRSSGIFLVFEGKSGKLLLRDRLKALRTFISPQIPTCWTWLNWWAESWRSEYNYYYYYYLLSGIKIGYFEHLPLPNLHIYCCSLFISVFPDPILQTSFYHCLKYTLYRS